MAGGKMSGRQKMINLMYLVFIAMLAMNMSKEVLTAFGFVNEKLTDNNIATTEKNNQAYASLATMASDQAAKFADLNKKALKIKSISLDFYTYLEKIKGKMMEGISKPKDYVSLDKTDFLDEYFFKGDGFTPEGEAFLAKINGHRTNLMAVLGKNTPFAAVVAKRFSTTDETNRDGKPIKWLEYRYKGYPLVASLANLTQLQSDIKNTEADVISSLLGDKIIAGTTLDNYKGIVALDKNAYFAGEKVAGKIVLGRYDATMIPDNVTLNGKDYKNIQSGQVIIDIPAGNVGTHDIKGKIAFTQNGEKVEVPFESSYSVIPEPSNAVVSADKMNVVYRGVDNPVSVSLPGVSDNNLKVSALNATLTGGKGKFIVKPGKGKEVTINVSAKLSSGKTVNSKATFRTKNLPPASGSIRGQFGTISMPKLSLSNIEVAAAYEDFVFDLKLTVKSFNLFVPGQLSVQVEGNKLSAAAKKVLNKAKRGDRISIFDIKAVKSDGVKIPKVRDVNIELTN